MGKEKSMGKDGKGKKCEGKSLRERTESVRKWEGEGNVRENEGKNEGNG